jgi:alpha-N-arabinofuranosidase
MIPEINLDTVEALFGWAPIKGASINVIADPVPLSDALPNSLELTIPSGSSGQVGFGNTGYWGMSNQSRDLYIEFTVFP